MHCYNEGLKYLKDKYGEKFLGHKESFLEDVRKLPYKKQKSALESANDSEKVTTFNNANQGNWPHEDQSVALLLGQYSLGNEPKKELYNILCDLGVMQPEN